MLQLSIPPLVSRALHRVSVDLFEQRKLPKGRMLKQSHRYRLGTDMPQNSDGKSFYIYSHTLSPKVFLTYTRSVQYAMSQIPDPIIHGLQASSEIRYGETVHLSDMGAFFVAALYLHTANSSSTLKIGKFTVQSDHHCCGTP
jgi:hypothetical protein